MKSAVDSSVGEGGEACKTGWIYILKSGSAGVVRNHLFVSPTYG